MYEGSLFRDVMLFTCTTIKRLANLMRQIVQFRAAFAVMGWDL